MLNIVEVVVISGVTTFLNLLLLGVFGFLNLSKLRRRSSYFTPAQPKTPFDGFVKQETSEKSKGEEKESEEKSQSRKLEKAELKVSNKYSTLLNDAYKDFVRAVNGKEEEGWISLGESKGIKRFK
ncbi:hypothetical protein RFI_28335 [Reticulomyxa filosa]|uniref:Uncharacterized protein n=1 Tax=Reticulomyxa filosa TaxID=46433 RepID=X6M4Z1_RETFI|nr:hypothetical protein RFI_28335 [Reticulomyxa filosa]|eukprot:ETO09053.1 hypothetical protein RFI_28335 [Reticulomyxa filosa]